ncbi:nucleoside/nucleotide kinase family protein [Ideonella margarita]|uniref:Nucleoside/nucleotide kinase family protein n=1 Tax=Ideonella margarita TaxID=2984191 RepID=A0ABU9C7W3_9BURK
MSNPTPALPTELLAHLDALIPESGRRLLGLIGPPGAGKSTLAAALLAARPGLCQVVPMDGFHLANSVLDHLGRRSRKGAPDTFDAAGFVALLQRLRQPVPGEVVYVPDYRRELEEPVAGAIAVPPEVPLLIVEGNYLLLDDGPWARVADYLNESWYVVVNDDLRRERLVARHERFGRTRAEALAWVEQTDEPNARRIAQGRHRATRQVAWAD